ncbi:hypothetical protein Poly59_08410 [Rubripirellula reticaptiva]|uniref:Uncharacterized protein n=1 Tax=Rubripirellula reticaptiva TaxID=2528013 RepID=A0A5C6FAY5_9BACT|nr:hypothetical protein Poly59_08410 [Rubripirellula reticaptiva]
MLQTVMFPHSMTEKLPQSFFASLKRRVSRQWENFQQQLDF